MCFKYIREFQRIFNEIWAYGKEPVSNWEQALNQTGLMWTTNESRTKTDVVRTKMIHNFENGKTEIVLCVCVCVNEWMCFCFANEWISHDTEFNHYFHIRAFESGGKICSSDFVVVFFVIAIFWVIHYDFKEKINNFLLIRKKWNL